MAGKEPTMADGAVLALACAGVPGFAPWGAPAKGAPVALGWALLRGTETLGSGHRLLRGADGSADPALAEQAERDGVTPRAALDEAQAAVARLEALGPVPLAWVAHNAEPVAAVLRREGFSDHPLAARLLTARRVCLCWDPRVRALFRGGPVRLRDLLAELAVPPPGRVADAAPVAAAFLALRARGTLPPPLSMAADSDARLYLRVPFPERHRAASEFGARFDGDCRRWWVPADTDAAALPPGWLEGPRRWLHVPFGENARARALGCRFCPQERRWYAAGDAPPGVPDAWLEEPPLKRGRTDA